MIKNSKVNKVGIALIFLFVAMTFSGCIGQEEEEVPESILIGASLPLSGSLAFLGETEKIGYEFGFADINDDGGIYIEEFDSNIPIDFKYYDDESDPTKSKSNAEKLITVDKVDFMLGSWGTPVVLGVGTAVEAHNHLLVTPGSASFAWEDQNYNRTFIVFHTSINETRPAFILFEEMDPATRPTKMAIWAEDTKIGETLAEWANKNAEWAGPQYEIVYEEIYTPGQVDYSAMILKTKEADPEVVFAVPTTPDGVTLIRQSEELGFSPKLYWFQRAGEPGEFWDLLGEDAEAMAAAMAGHPLLPIAGNLELTERYQNEYGKMPSAGLPVSYACVQVLAEAIEQAGTLDRDKVRDVLLTLEMDTVIGKVIFSGPCHALIEPLVFQWQNGEQVIVWPEKYATGDFKYPRR